MKRVGWVALAVLMTWVAGCADDGGTQIPTQDSPVFEDVVITDDTGAILGIVYSEAIVPIANVTVKITSTGAETTTGADGAFAFSDLPPGDYFLSASKVGFVTTQSSATVVAGVKEPDLVRMQLVATTEGVPVAQLQTWRAVLQCGVFVIAGSVNPCFLTGSDNVHQFEFDGGTIPTFAQAEAVWEGSQPLGNYLLMMWNGEQGGNRADNISPLVINATEKELISGSGKDVARLQMRLFPGGGPSGTNPTVVVNQNYDIYVTYFYGFTPRAGWTFAEFGECTRIEQCG